MQFSPVAFPRVPATGNQANTESIQVRPVATAETVAAAPTAATVAGRQTAVVRRSPISEVLTLSGRVAGQEENDLSFPSSGRVQAVRVEAGQSVNEGDVLIEADPKEVEKNLAAARDRLDAAKLRLQQGQGQAQTRQRDSDQRQQKALLDAQDQLRRALADQERIMAGAPASERQAAQAALISAQAGLEKARANLDRSAAGPSQDDVRSAEQQAQAAWIAVQKADAELARLRSGPDPADVQAAQQAAASAQSGLDRARADLARLLRGPDPLIVSAAEREVQRAQSALAAAQAANVTDKASRASRDAAVEGTSLTLQTARERLDALRRPPPATDVQIAQRNVEAAQAGLEAANQRLAKIGKGPDQLTLDAAGVAIDKARSDFEAAGRRLEQLKSGPPADQLRDARAGVDSAQATLDSAQKRLAELGTHPTPAEARGAVEQVAAARAALDLAQSQATPPQAADASSPDAILLQKSVDQEQAQVDLLERSLASTHLMAPFAGVVTALQVRAGDSFDADRPVVTVAKPGDPIVQVEATERTGAARLAVGQAATVRLDGSDSAGLEALLVGLTDADGGRRTATLQVVWPTTPAPFGTTARAVITLQQKDDALVVSQKAVRTAGSRRYVDTLSGTSRRTVDVQVGIAGLDDVEILGGLSEGQVVLIGP